MRRDDVLQQLQQCGAIISTAAVAAAAATCSSSSRAGRRRLCQHKAHDLRQASVGHFHAQSRRHHLAA